MRFSIWWKAEGLFAPCSVASAHDIETLARNLMRDRGVEWQLLRLGPIDAPVFVIEPVGGKGDIYARIEPA